MSILLNLLDQLGNRYAGLKWRFYRMRFVLLEKPRHVALEIGRGSYFNVPVRGGGRGALRIGSENCFGDRTAYRWGSGQIMIYAGNPTAVIIIGDRNFVNNNVVIGAMEKITIGSDCLIGDCVSITDCDFHEINPNARRQGQGTKKPIAIGNNVWLGSGVTVLKGVSIGENSVVGARSVVTKSVPANCIAAGNPARIIRGL